MRPLLDMDTIQVEITNACINSCSNCTRFCGHHEKPYFMEMDFFKKAIDSMVRYPKMTGIMGGEPLLHPRFTEFCDYALSKIPKERLGLWTCLPRGYEHYREVICRTFGSIFLNDHSRDDVLHSPLLVASQEVRKGAPFRMWWEIDKCWIQNNWSASINPKGAWFCEVAGALAILFGSNGAWEVKPGWWGRIPKDYAEQMEQYCVLCGGAMPLQKRESWEGIDDISLGNLERLRGISRKVAAGKYRLHNSKTTEDKRPMATYKDETYRDVIASRYGIFLVLKDDGFQEPYLR